MTIWQRRDPGDDRGNSGPTRTGHKETTTGGARHVLLETGRTMLGRLRVSDVLPGVRAVCRGADLPTGSFYCAYRNASTFYRRLIGSAAANDPAIAQADETEVMLTELGRLEGSDGSGTTDKSVMIARLVAATFEEFRASCGESFRTQLLLTGAAMGDDSELADVVRASYRDMYNQSNDCYQAGYQAVLDGWGHKLREPLDLRSVVIVVTALFDGMALRSEIDTDLDAVTILEDAVRLLVSAALTSGGADVVDLDSFLASQLSAVS